MNEVRQVVTVHSPVRVLSGYIHKCVLTHPNRNMIHTCFCRPSLHPQCGQGCYYRLCLYSDLPSDSKDWTLPAFLTFAPRKTCLCLSAGAATSRFTAIMPQQPVVYMMIADYARVFSLISVKFYEALLPPAPQGAPFPGRGRSKETVDSPLPPNV